MKSYKYIYILGLALISINSFAQKERKYIRQGNKEFEKANFDNSEISYRKAVDLEEKKTHEPAFNVGDALYKQEKYEDAAEQFKNLADYELSKEEKAKVYHNLGNSFLQSKKYQESIEAFKNALRNNPTDLDTKYNLAYAQKKLEEQQQQQQSQDQDQNQDNKDQDKQEQNEDKQEQNQDKNQQDKQDQQQQQQPEISKEDAERILQALANDEKDTQQKVKEQQAAAAKVKVEKEW